MTKQWTLEWLYITNVVFRIVQNHGEPSYFRRFGVAIAPLNQPLFKTVVDPLSLSDVELRED